MQQLASRWGTMRPSGVHLELENCSFGYIAEALCDAMMGCVKRDHNEITLAPNLTTKHHNSTMNCSLYSIQAFVIIDSEGNRVLAKYYHPRSHPDGESKEFNILKDQKAFEKGLWQKTKKAGGKSVV